MDACTRDEGTNAATFEELYHEMGSDLYWVRFFARPCCPAPNAQDACQMLDHLARDVDSRDDFTSEQKRTLHEVIEERKAWYPTSGLCRKG